jgi:hypothetical protein
MKPTILLYTHSDVKDVWPLFFDQTNKYLGDFRKSVIVNKDDEDIPNEYVRYLYDDKNNYINRNIQALSLIEDEFVLFQHEDMFLYNTPDINKLEEYTEYLKNSDMSFIKLIRGGEQVGESDDKFPELKKITSNFDYIFAIQPSIWKTKKLLEVFKNTTANTIWEFEWNAQQTCREKNIYGWYVDDGGKKRGRSHWDSKVYPYVATAIVKGKWCSEYILELYPLFLKHKIDPMIRKWT